MKRMTSRGRNVALPAFEVECEGGVWGVDVGVGVGVWHGDQEGLREIWPWVSN